MPLKSPTLAVLHLLVIACAAPAWAEPARGGAARPLNLSLPHDFMHAPQGHDATEPARRNLEAPASAPPALPYGSGYESRQTGQLPGAALPGSAARPGASSVPSAPATGPARQRR